MQGANELFQYSDVLKNFRRPFSRPEKQLTVSAVWKWLIVGVRDTQLYHG
jgi:hypothetical protein